MNRNTRPTGSRVPRPTVPAVPTAVLAGLALLLGPTPAYAAPPTHENDDFTEAVTLDAGELCDVAVEQSLVFSSRSTTFGDPAEPDRVIVRARATFTYTNLESGARVTDEGRFVFTILDDGAAFVVRGLGARLRDGNGRLIDVSAGRVVLDATTGEPVAFTPNTEQDYATLVCAGLGAAPAG